jgi:hypothetical protein
MTDAVVGETDTMAGRAAWVTVNVAVALPAVTVSWAERSAPGFAVAMALSVAPFVPEVRFKESQAGGVETVQEA